MVDDSNMGYSCINNKTLNKHPICRIQVIFTPFTNITFVVKSSTEAWKIYTEGSLDRLFSLKPQID